MKLNRLKSWFVAFSHWIAEANPMIVCFLVILAALLLGLFTWSSEISIRASGYVLQLIGMVFAVRGLLSVRAHFGQPLLRVLLMNWFKRFPRWKRNVVVGVGTANLAVVGMKARAEVWTPDDPSKSIEERIAGLVKNLERIREGQRQHLNLIDDLSESQKEHKKETEKRNKEIEKDIRSDLEVLHTGDLIVSLVGLIWLTVGITLSTLAPEIYLLIN